MSGADFTKIEVEGARRLRSTLRKAGIDVRDDLKKAHKSAAAIVARDAAKRRPWGLAIKGIRPVN